MLNSMTGFAALSGDEPGIRWDWELRAVNARGLDLRLRLPEGGEAMEPLIRTAAKAIKRGNVTVSLKVSRMAPGGATVLDTEALANALQQIAAVEQAAVETHVALAPSRAADVLGLPGVTVTDRAVEDFPAAVAAQLPALFADFAAMRAGEGQALGKVLAEQLNEMERLTKAAAASAEARATRAGETLKARVAALMDSTDLADPGRLQQELAQMAVKSDVTEEIDRLTAHVAAARAQLDTGGAVGRKLDFLMQEFNREANTLCSKAQDPDLTAIGLEMKVIIDQMREQVQNLE